MRDAPARAALAPGQPSPRSTRRRARRCPVRDTPSRAALAPVARRPHGTQLLEPRPPSPPQHAAGGAARAGRAPARSQLDREETRVWPSGAGANVAVCLGEGEEASQGRRQRLGKARREGGGGVEGRRIARGRRRDRLAGLGGHHAGKVAMRGWRSRKRRTRRYMRD
ncbi:hypothetical protein PVAP13_2NG258318 [Panicum virgatum]|uniref:Uncharacterized protein n=1 Tax=Panicum virgatum TaxID=38727 RepID=A0A8T0VIJ5_PANVG|nr:hypothetical protein PVAP13_2NG258318 [Panicum virgatum]